MGKEDYDEPPNILLITGSTSKATQKAVRENQLGRLLLMLPQLLLVP